MRADVRKLGKDIKDSFDDLNKFADDTASKISKSISSSFNDSLNDITVKVNVDEDHFLRQMAGVEGILEDFDGQTANLGVEVNVNSDDIYALDDILNNVNGKIKLDIDKAYIERQILEVEDIIGNFLDNDIVVGIRTDVSDLQNITKDIVDTVNDINGRDNMKVKVSPMLDTSASGEIISKVDDIVDEARGILSEFDITLKADADYSEALAALEALREELKELEESDIEIYATIDQSSIEEINATIETMRQQNEANAIDLEVEIHTAKAFAQLTALARRRTVEIVPKINAKALGIAQGTLAGFTGFNIMKDHTKDFIESLTELDKQLPQTAMLLSALSAAVPAAGWGAGTLMNLIGDVAALSGLLVPGSAALAAYAGGMYFFNNAFEKANKEKYIPEITAQLEKFSSVVAGDFWSVAKPSYNEFAFKTLPAIYQASKGVNTGTAELASSFWDALGAVVASDRGMANLKETTGNIEAGMKGLGDAFEPAIQGILQFITIGSGQLPPLGKAIESVAIDFDNWMQDVENQKAIEEWGIAGVETLKELGSIVYSTTGIFYSLYRAARQSGFPGLTEIADGLENINNKLAEDSSQEQMIMYGQYFNSAFSQMASSISWAGPLISKHSDGILRSIETMGDIASEILLGIGDMFTNTGLVEAFFGLLESFNTAVVAFRPAFESLGIIFAVTMEFLGAALENITPILTQFFKNLERDAVLIKPALMGILDIIGEWGPQVMEVVGEVTNAVAQWFGNLDPVIALLGIGIAALAPVFMGLGAVIWTVISGISGAVATIGGLVAGAGTLSGALSKASSGTGFFASALQALRGVGEAVSSRFGLITTAFGEFVGAARNTSGAVLGAMGELGSKIWRLIAPPDGLIRSAWGTLLGDMVYVRDAFGDAVEAMGKRIGGFGTAISTRLAPIGQFFRNSIATPISGAVTTVGNALTRVMPSLGGFGSGLGTLGGSFGSVLSSVAKFIPGIGQIVSVFITAFMVSEDLRKAIGTFLVNAFKTIAAVIKPILAPLWELIMVLGEVFTEIGVKAAPIFTSFFGLLNSLMPIIQLVAYAVGTVLGAAIRLVITAIKTAWAVISPIFDGIVTVVTSIIDIVSGVVTAFVDFGKALADGASFGEAFSGLIGDLGSTLKDGLVGIFEGLVETISGVFEGLVGGAGELFSGILDAIIGVFESFDIFPQGQAILQSLIDGFMDKVNGVREWLQNLTEQIIEWKGPPSNDATLLNDAGASIIQSLIDGFISVVQSVFTFLQTLTQQIVNVVMGIVMGVVTLFQTGWAMLTTIVQGVWNAVLLVIQGAWTFIITYIQIAIANVTLMFQTGWNILVTIVTGVFMAIQAAISGAWTVIITFISTALTAVVSIFSTIWNAVLNVVMTVWTAITSIISTYINAVVSVVSTVLGSIINIIGTIWNTVKTVTQTVWNGIKALLALGLAAIKALISGNFAAFRSIISSIWNTIKSITTSVWNTIKSGISSVVNSIKAVITSVFNAIRNVIRSVMNGIKSVISSIWNGIRSTISSVVNGIRNVISSTFNAIRSVISSVMSTVRSIISSVWSSIRSTISSAVSGVRSNISSGFNALRGIVSNAWNAVVTVVRSSANRMLGIVRGIPGQIKGALGNLGGLLKGAGKSIIQGLIDGVTGMIGTLKDKFSGITNMIPDWKGPPDTDAKLLTNAGELIMEGLIEGLESKYGAVKNSLQGFTGELSQTVGTQIGADVGLSTSVRNTALSDAERRLSYRSNSDSMVQSSGGSGEVHLHFHNTLVNEEEIIMVVNREFGRG